MVAVILALAPATAQAAGKLDPTVLNRTLSSLHLTPQANLALRTLMGLRARIFVSDVMQMDATALTDPKIRYEVFNYLRRMHLELSLTPDEVTATRRLGFVPAPRLSSRLERFGFTDAELVKLHAAELRTLRDALGKSRSFLRRMLGNGLTAQVLAKATSLGYHIYASRGFSDLLQLDITPDVYDILIDHNIHTQNQLASMSDQEVLALGGISLETLRKLRVRIGPVGCANTLRPEK